MGVSVRNFHRKSLCRAEYPRREASISNPCASDWGRVRKEIINKKISFGDEPTKKKIDHEGEFFFAVFLSVPCVTSAAHLRSHNCLARARLDAVRVVAISDVDAIRGGHDAETEHFAIYFEHFSFLRLLGFALEISFVFVNRL